MQNRTPLSSRKLLLFLMITIWAMRLGTYLFVRVIQVGEDWRFKRVKYNARTFFIYWTMQGVWVCMVKTNFLLSFYLGIYWMIRLGHQYGWYYSINMEILKLQVKYSIIPKKRLFFSIIVSKSIEWINSKDPYPIQID